MARNCAGRGFGHRVNIHSVSWEAVNARVDWIWPSCLKMDVGARCGGGGEERPKL